MALRAGAGAGGGVPLRDPSGERVRRVRKARREGVPVETGVAAHGARHAHLPVRTLDQQARWWKFGWHRNPAYRLRLGYAMLRRVDFVASTAPAASVPTTMDPATGMLPAAPCARCGRPLGESGRPAELYAGTFTGLCYGCERTGPYPAGHLPDGAVRFSYPPHCPSWRRDREEFWAYPDCADCGGAGCHWQYRNSVMGGSYRTHCAPCQERATRPYRENTAAAVAQVADALDALAATRPDGDPLDALKLAVRDAMTVALSRTVDEPAPWSPTVATLQTRIEQAAATVSLDAARPATILGRLARALRREAAR